MICMKMKMTRIKLLFNTGYGIGEGSALYSFSKGAMKESHFQQANIGQDGLWHIVEDDIETGVYTEEEYYTGHEILVNIQELKDNHTHTALHLFLRYDTMHLRRNGQLS